MLTTKFYFISSLAVNMEGTEVTFLFQFGNLRDLVAMPASMINLKSLKDLACDFINSKVSSNNNNVMLYNITITVTISDEFKYAIDTGQWLKSIIRTPTLIPP